MSSNPEPVAGKVRAQPRYLTLLSTPLPETPVVIQGAIAAGGAQHASAPFVPMKPAVPPVKVAAKPAPVPLVKVEAQPAAVPPVKVAAPPAVAGASAAPSPDVGDIPQGFIEYVDNAVLEMRDTQLDEASEIHARFDLQQDLIERLFAALQASEDKHSEILEKTKVALEVFNGALQLQVQEGVDATKASVIALRDEVNAKIATTEARVTALEDDIEKKFDAKVDVVQARVTALEDDIEKKFDAKVDVVQASVNALGFDIEKKFDAKVDVVQASVNALEDDIEKKLGVARDSVTDLWAIVRENQGKSDVFAQNQSALHGSVLALGVLLAHSVGQQAMHAQTLLTVEMSVDGALLSIDAIVRESTKRAGAFDHLYDMVYVEKAAVSVHNYRNDFVFSQFALDHADKFKEMESPLEKMESTATAHAQNATGLWKKEIVDMKTFNAKESESGLAEATRKTAEASALSQSENADIHRMQTDISEALSKFQGSTTPVPSLSPAPPAAPTPAPSVAPAPSAAPVVSPAAAPAAALVAAPAADPAAAPVVSPAAAPPADPAAASPADPLAGAPITTAATKIAVKGPDSVIVALSSIQSDDARFSEAVALLCALPKVCARIYKAIYTKTKAAGGTAELPEELQKTAMSKMVFTPEAFNGDLYKKMRAGSPIVFKNQPSGGFCIEGGKTIEEIMTDLGSTIWIPDMNRLKLASRDRIFTLYMQQFMASGDKTALAILDLFEVSPSTV